MIIDNKRFITDYYNDIPFGFFRGCIIDKLEFLQKPIDADTITIDHDLLFKEYSNSPKRILKTKNNIECNSKKILEEYPINTTFNALKDLIKTSQEEIESIGHHHFITLSSCILFTKDGIDLFNIRSHAHRVDARLQKKHNTSHDLKITTHVYDNIYYSEYSYLEDLLDFTRTC